ncbi:MAG: DUF1385 domain-containing protein [Flintibacter sp.]|uniref:DUF1385 domain-containing protein n=1 Tax=Eubacteriales TaxID=186802 RepID=UPI001ADF6610|nr:MULTISPECIES: DUF1385 domain-containing protein [Eubacteriales]MCI6150554.1 DUF1385 domain-containing protein [Flintibacter sp.]MCI7281508.1 DUF1385 domain-containing protein [Dysosmobacter sp.]MCI7659383.1 DUF1385 domain-containing protein [Flintibacter sp.]MDY5038468.1 DUF1385 domain-containing protein [Lawsonibacter sp.]
MSNPQNPRLGAVGGQAVLDGVMMKAEGRCAVSVRCPDGSIQTELVLFQPLGKRHPILGLPLIRGFINFCQMLALGQRVLSISVVLTDPEPEQTASHVSERLFTAAVWIFAVVLSVGLFMLLPASVVKLGGRLLPLDSVWLKNIVEGLVRICVLLTYLLLTSLMPDMRRTFEYHGAEHKSVACYEAGEPLTPENAARHTRFHPRCGTSFLFMMIFVGILFYSLPIFSWNSVWERVLTKLLFFPVISGVGYEIIRFSGRHPGNLLLRILTAPGLWLQHITTREPSLEQLEVAITALRNSLENQ